MVSVGECFLLEGSPFQAGIVVGISFAQLPLEQSMWPLELRAIWVRSFGVGSINRFLFVSDLDLELPVLSNWVVMVGDVG